MSDLHAMLDDLRKPFHPSQVQWLPGAVKGERALAIAYADLRAYMNRLDEVCGDDWSVAYEPWGEDRIICRLTIGGVMRSSTGETTNESERSEIGGTVAEAQAFKRACAMFGLGRYLYNLPSGWADFDPATKKFTDRAKAKLTGILVQHYRRANDIKSEMADIFSEESTAEVDSTTETAVKLSARMVELLKEFDALGNELYAEQWDKVRRRNVKRISGGSTEQSDQLHPDHLQQLIDGMGKIKGNRVPISQPTSQNAPTLAQTAQDNTREDTAPTNGSDDSETALVLLFEEFNTLGDMLYGEQWPMVRKRNAKRISGGETQEASALAPEQIRKLIDGMKIVQSQRVHAEAA